MLFIHLASAGWLKRRKVAWPRQMVQPEERGERAQPHAGAVPERGKAAAGAGRQPGAARPEDASLGGERAPAVSRGLGGG